MQTGENFDLEKEIQNLKKALESGKIDETANALEEAIQLLRSLDDERKSLWHMLDEIKDSDTKNYADLFMQGVKKKIDMTRMSVSRKVGLA